MRRLSTSRAAIALLAFLWSGAAAAQEQAAGAAERAREELRELRYEDALATLSTALKAGSNGPAATAQIYLLLGEVQASLGKETEAEQAFQRALAIGPGLQLRKGVSPKIARPFRQARRAQRGLQPLAIAHRVLTRDPPTIAVFFESNPFGMMVGARVEYWTGRAGSSRSVAAAAGKARDQKDPIHLELPSGVTRFAVAGVDEHGNRVVELGSEEEPLLLDAGAGDERASATGTDGGASTAEPEGAPAPEMVPSAPVIQADRGPDDRPPFYASWILWGGVTVALAGAGTWAGLSANAADNKLERIRESEFEFEYSAAKRVADRAEQRSLIANICFAAAGVSAAAAAILYIRGRKGNGEEAAALTPLVSPDQIGIAASLRF